MRRGERDGKREGKREGGDIHLQLCNTKMKLLKGEKTKE